MNSRIKAHLRGLESEFGDSTNSIRLELNRLEGAGLLISERDGNKKLFRANDNHPLFNDIHNIILKEAGIDKIVEKVITRLGSITSVYLTGDYAHGKNGPSINLILVGREIDREYLARKIQQSEELIKRKVRFIILDPEEAESFISGLSNADYIPLWESE